MEKVIGQLVESAGYWLPALTGGAVDYLNQVQRGDKKWSIYGFAVHLFSAIFFGWLVGTLTVALGYEAGVVAASGGMGGFLGVRAADLITYRLMRVDRRKD